MGRPKGSKSFNRYWSKEEKLRIVKLVLDNQKSILEISIKENISTGLLSKRIKNYINEGVNSLENKRKPGNPYGKVLNKKDLTDLGQLQFENMKRQVISYQ